MTYNSNSIQTLDQITHIRKRIGMYVGSQGSDGIFHLFREVLDNSVDEYKAGHGKKINIHIDDTGILVADEGRGIPFDKVVDVFTKERTSGKFNTDSYEFSAGLNGYGLKIVNALSEELSVSVTDDKVEHIHVFSRGLHKNFVETSNTINGYAGTSVRFKPDPQIFGTAKISDELVRIKLFELTNIFPGLRIEYNYFGDVTVFEETTPLTTMHTKGINVTGSIFNLQQSKNNTDVLIDYCQDSQCIINSFINSINTTDHGSHVDAVYDALVASLKKITGKIFSKSQLSQGLRLTISTFFNAPNYRGQSKSKVSDDGVYKQIYDSIYTDLYNELTKNKSFTDYLVNLATQQERVMQELDIKRAINTVKTAAKDNKLPLKLAIAHNCTSDTRELFLVEGNSAGGTVKTARNKNFQEVLPLRGKVMNAYKSQYSDLLSNREVVDIFLAIGGMENTNTNLRCKNVFIMADADPDGSHINALLISMFAVIFPSFVKNNNLYVVEPPLFVLISDDIRIFGHDSKQLAKDFKKQYGNKSFEVYRNKGLGEMNPEELEPFINPKTRIVTKVEVNDNSVTELMKLMGDFSDVRKSMLDLMVDEDSDGSN